MLIVAIYMSLKLINSSRLANAINLTAQIDLSENENLVLWLETTNINKEEKTNTKLYTWNDLSINKISFSNSTNPPIFKGSKTFGGINSLSFDNNTLKSNNILNLKKYTIFVVANPTVSNGKIYDFGFSLKPNEMSNNKIIILKNNGVEKFIKLNNKDIFKFNSPSDIPNIAQETNTIGSDGFKGEIFEIIIFNKVLSNEQINKIENYLYNKYDR